jgi:kynurenine formamidase
VATTWSYPKETPKRRKTVFKAKARGIALLVVFALVIGLLVSSTITLAAPDKPAPASSNTPKVDGWTQGVGWGPWGPEDEVGALNALNAAMVKKATQKVNDGIVYDLDPGRHPGMFLWPGHPPFMNLTYRTPAWLRALKVYAWTDPSVNPQKEYWISEVTSGTQHSGAHLDSLAHLTTQIYGDKPQDDDYWYNGWNAKDYLGDFGPMKADISTTPPVVNRGVLIDVYGYLADTRGVEYANSTLVKGFEITPQLMQETLDWESKRSQGQGQGKIDIEPGDSCLIRTGLLRLWPDVAALSAADGAGPAMAGSAWLVKEKGCILVASDTSAFEMQPAAAGESFNPAHILLLIQQGVHIGELFYLEDLAADQVYEFLFIVTPNRIKGATGSMVRPIAIK